MTLPLILCTVPLKFFTPDTTKYAIRVVGDETVGAALDQKLLIETTNRLCPDGIFCSFDGTTLFDATFFESLSDEARDRLKVIANHGVGYNHIDISAATRQKIWISHTPDVVTDATADIALYLMLCVSRKANAYEQAIRAGASFSEAKKSVGYGCSLRNKNLAIVGMGRIGKAVAQRAISFGMRIFYVKRNRLSEQEERELRVCGYAPTVNELLSDHEIHFLSVNCPLNAETHHLIGAEELALLPNGKSFVINTARGAIIDEQALVDSLVSGHVRGAGLDVFENEPVIHPLLLELDPSRVVLVPHIGTEVVETRLEMETLCMQNLESTLLGEQKRPLTPVPEQRDMTF